MPNEIAVQTPYLMRRCQWLKLLSYLSLKVQADSIAVACSMQVIQVTGRNQRDKLQCAMGTSCAFWQSFGDLLLLMRLSRGATYHAVHVGDQL